jgi:hypothetical protein
MDNDMKGYSRSVTKIKKRGMKKEGKYNNNGRPLQYSPEDV